MILLLIALASVSALVLLARMEGAVAAEDEPPNADNVHAEAPLSGQKNLQHEVLRYAGTFTAVVAGGTLAGGLAQLAEPGVALIPLALLLVLACATGLCAVVIRQQLRTGARQSAPPYRALAKLSGALRIVRRAGARIANLGGPRSSSRSEIEASEQFSRVLSSEVDMTQDEAKLLRGAILLRRTTAHDVMAPRVAIVGLEAGTPWSEVLDRVRSSEHSRLPVFRDSLDDVLGILVAKDLLPFTIADTAPSAGWRQLVRPAAFVPSTKPVDDVLREFRVSRTHMAIVVDEYGGTAGLLTLEDVLEEVVGEIRDEHDVEEPPILTEGDSRFWVLGRVPLHVLQRTLGEDIDGGQATTVGGLVFEQLGRVPEVGEELSVGSFRVVVERMKRHAVDRVYFERLDATRENE